MAKKQVESLATDPDIQEVVQRLEQEATVVPAGIDPEIDHLRQELAARERELEDTRAELARRDAIAQPLPNSGPGRYLVMLRHAPSRLKKLEVEADSEADAWKQFIQAGVKAAWNPKDPMKKEVKAFEAFLQRGKIEGYDRTIQKVA